MGLIAAVKRNDVGEARAWLTKKCSINKSVLKEMRNAIGEILLWSVQRNDISRFALLKFLIDRGREAGWDIINHNIPYKKTFEQAICDFHHDSYTIGQSDDAVIEYIEGLRLFNLACCSEIYGLEAIEYMLVNNVDYRSKDQAISFIGRSNEALIDISSCGQRKDVYKILESRVAFNSRKIELIKSYMSDEE